MLPTLPIGPSSIQVPGLIILLGLWLGLVVAERLAPRFKANPNEVYNLVFVILIAGLLGARIGYILQHFPAFVESPLSVISLNPGLLDPLAGAAVGLIAALIYGNRKQISWRPTLDAITPFLAVMMIAIGLANLASGDGFGAETDLPWGIYLWGTMRHPTQIYLSLAGGVILWIIWPRQRVSEQARRVPGETFGLFLALSSAAWIMIETFRGDSVLLPGGLRTVQIAAWILLAFSLWWLGKLSKRSALCL